MNNLMLIIFLISISTLVSWVYIPSLHNTKNLQMRNAFAMVLSSDLEIIFDPTKDNINGLRKVARMLVDEANEDKKALLEAKNDLIASNGKEIQLRAEISELEKNIVSAYRKLHATTQRDVIGRDLIIGL
mmetsp:Transcript_26868/g.37025  ORF Transcript_26868/g.37025 Transcript_26868/m.37025 type:complete len:130 (-) Transcript_26868:468-857(-)